MLKLELEGNKYNIPESAQDLALYRYDQIRILIENKTISGITSPWSYADILQVINYMTDIPQEIIGNAPVTFFELIFKKIEWVFNFDVDAYKPQSYIEWENERYSYEETHDWLVKEWVDFDEISKNFPAHDKFACFMAVKVRKMNKDKNGKYITGIEDYHPDMISQRKEMFKQMPISVIAPLIGFFLAKENLFNHNLGLYSQELALGLIQHHQLSDWAQNGDGFKRWPAWRKTIFLNWMTFLTKELSKHLILYRTQSTNQMPSTMQLNTINSNIN